MAELQASISNFIFYVLFPWFNDNLLKRGFNKVNYEVGGSNIKHFPDTLEIVMKELTR